MTPFRAKREAESGTRTAPQGGLAIRVQTARLRKLMRARRVATQSELINTLLTEEEEERLEMGELDIFGAHTNRSHKIHYVNFLRLLAAGRVPTSH
jgi:hypothetical protein